MQFYEFSLSCHVLKRLLLFTRLSLWRLCSHYLFMSLFPSFFSASKKCDFGKTRARSCWWIVTGMILQEYLQTNVWILVLNTLIFHSWPVLPKIQIPRQHWLGTVMTIHYLMVLVSISQLLTCLRHRNLQNIRILQIFVLILFNDSATNNLRRLLD